MTPAATRPELSRQFLKVERESREAVRHRLESAIDFHEFIGDGAIALDELARAIQREDVRAGANVRPVNHEDDAALQNALPTEALRTRFRNYVDALQGECLYYAEAGYELGLEVAREMQRLAGGAR